MWISLGGCYKGAWIQIMESSRHKKWDGGKKSSEWEKRGVLLGQGYEQGMSDIIYVIFILKNKIILNKNDENFFF